MKVVGYVRRSSDKQDKSIPDQKHEIERYAQQHGLNLLNFYEDDAVSGTSTKGRDGFKQMIQAVEGSNGHPPFDAILVWDVKRFSRGDICEVGYYIHLLRMHGVEVIHISEGFRGDDTDDLMLSVKQWQARGESKDKSKDVIRGMLSRIQKGHGSPGHAYAYYRKVEGPNGEGRGILKRGKKRAKLQNDIVTLVPGDPFEIEVVRRMLDSYVNRGMGKWVIARMLNSERIPSPRGKRWGVCAVDYILRNPVYIGWLAFNRTGKAKFYRIVKNGEGYFEAQDKGKLRLGEFERHDESQWIIVKGAHEPIVPEELFWKAQEVRKERATTGYPRGRATVSPYLWSGLIRCQLCGGKLSGYTQRGVEHNWQYYVCSGCLVLPNRKKTPVPGNGLDAYILGRIEEKVQSPERLVAVVKAVESALKQRFADTEEKKVALERKLQANGEMVKQLIEAIEVRNRDLINERLDELRKERIVLENEIRGLTNQPQTKELRKLANELVEHAKDFHRVFSRGTMSERKLFLRAYVQGITVNPAQREAVVGFYRLPRIPQLVEEFISPGSR